MKLPVDDMCNSCRCHMLNGIRALVHFVGIVAYQWNNSNYCYLLSVPL